MNILQVGTMRRRWRIGMIVGALAVAALSGCGSAEDAGVEDAAPAPAEDAAFDPGTGGDSGGVSAPVAEERDVIITGWLYMTVDDPIASAQLAADFVKEADGRIDGRSETGPHGDSGGSAELVMRIPSKRLDDVVDQLRALGSVDEYSTQSSDVTTQVIDLEASISTLEASIARVEELIADAKDLGDVITLESELSARQAELQSLEAQQRGLDDQVSMSTITLVLTTEPVTVIEDDDNPSFLDGLSAGWAGLVDVVTVTLVVIGALIPWVIPIGLIVGGIVWINKQTRGPRERRKAEKLARSQAARASYMAYAGYGAQSPYATQAAWGAYAQQNATQQPATTEGDAEHADAAAEAPAEASDEDAQAKPK